MMTCSVGLSPDQRDCQPSLHRGHRGGRPGGAALWYRLRARGQGQRLPRPLVQEGLRDSYIQVSWHSPSVLGEETKVPHPSLCWGKYNELGGVKIRTKVWYNSPPQFTYFVFHRGNMIFSKGLLWCQKLLEICCKLPQTGVFITKLFSSVSMRPFEGL